MGTTLGLALLFAGLAKILPVRAEWQSCSHTEKVSVRCFHHTAEIAAAVGKSLLTVRRWRQRYVAKGAEGLLKDHRPWTDYGGRRRSRPPRRRDFCLTGRPVALDLRHPRRGDILSGGGIVSQQ
jgi:hypothetical protein